MANYGVFLARKDSEPRFRVNYCGFSRNDNSVDSWDQMNDQVFSWRREVVQIPEDNISFDLGDDVFLCHQTQYVINPGDQPPIGAYKWSTGSEGTSLVVTQSGKYYLTVTNGCWMHSDTVRVQLDHPLQPLDLGPDLLLCEGSTLEIKLANLVAASYQWSTGSRASSISVTTSGTYSLVVSNACNSVEDHLKVKFQKFSYDESRLPSVITANHDDVNDYFVIPLLIDDKIALDVYNRWGRKVYSDLDYKNEFNAQGLPAGVYFYTLISGCGGQAKGTITVLR